MNRAQVFIPLSAVVVALISACAGEPNQDFDLTDAHLIDTRERFQWAVRHVEGARHIDWDCIVLGVQYLGIGEDEPIVVYGTSSTAAGRAETSLRNMDYQLVRNAGSVQEAADLLDRSIVSAADTEPDADDLAIQAACEERREIRQGL